MHCVIKYEGFGLLFDPERIDGPNYDYFVAGLTTTADVFGCHTTPSKQLRLDWGPAPVKDIALGSRR